MAEIVFFGNSLFSWATAGIVLVLTFTIILGFLRFLSSRVSSLAGKTANRFDDSFSAAIKKSSPLLLFTGALYFAGQCLELTDAIELFLYRIFVLAAVLQIARWLSALSVEIVGNYLQRSRGDDPASATALGLARFALRCVVWSISLLIILENFGIDVTALLAGLGVGGIAIALAVQNVLGDLFASLSIVLDRPFQVGDFIIIDDLMGTVESIGLKTTRLRSLSGEQLVLSNSDLLGSRIKNYKRMQSRRVVFALGITYQTPRVLVEAIPEAIREIIESLDDLRFDRSHFKSFGDSALEFETVYYIETPDYGIYMDRQQVINLEIMKYFEDKGIEFAYPTQTLFVEQSSVVEKGSF